MALASRTDQKTTKKLAAISAKIKSTRMSFSDLMIPIVVATVLLLLSIFVFVPMINAALSYQAEIKDTDSKISQLESLEKELALIDENKLSEDIILAKSVIPKILKVSDFIFYVDNLANEKGLLIRELSAGDMGGRLLPSENSGAGVSGPISYVGEYTSVVSFLEEVQSISPYIIRVENVEISQLTTGQWGISLSLSGYYMADRNGIIDIYKPFKSYTEYQEILEIFEQKAKNL